MRYIDLMGGSEAAPARKPRRTTWARRPLIHYAPSTKFYVSRQARGHALGDPAAVPRPGGERVETFDYVSRNLSSPVRLHLATTTASNASSAASADVDQWDTEEFATLTNSPNAASRPIWTPASDVPPVLTKTWFHTGAYFGEAAVSASMQGEYYAEGDPSTGIAGLTSAQLSNLLLDDTILPVDILLPDGTRLAYALSPEEAREACRALRGSMLRQEIYAVDGTTAADRPYSVSERNYTIEALQPQGPNQYGVFFVHPRETVDFRYERQLYPVAGGTIAAPGAAPPQPSRRPTRGSATCSRWPSTHTEMSCRAQA